MYLVFLQGFFLESHPFYDQTHDLARVFDYLITVNLVFKYFKVQELFGYGLSCAFFFFS
jgi:hypothetical protein